jgi:hypothetical protein
VTTSSVGPRAKFPTSTCQSDPLSQAPEEISHAKRGRELWVRRVAKPETNSAKGRVRPTHSVLTTTVPSVPFGALERSTLSNGRQFLLRQLHLADSKDKSQDRRVGCVSIENPSKLLILWKLAERVGFEPTLPFRVNTLSKRAPSATRPSLRRESVGRDDPYRRSHFATNLGVRAALSFVFNSKGELVSTAT